MLELDLLLISVPLVSILSPMPCIKRIDHYRIGLLEFCGHLALKAVDWLASSLYIAFSYCRAQEALSCGNVI